MIKVYALEASYNACYYELSALYPEASMRYDPIERNSLYAALLKDYCQERHGVYSNISHSGRWCVCCCGDLPCGIDIEKIRNIPQHIVHGIKLPDFNGTSTQSVNIEFLMRWIMLESYLKYTGKGFNGYASIEKDYPADAHNIKFKFFNKILDYLICICTNIEAEVNEDIYILSAEEILKWSSELKK